MSKAPAKIQGGYQAQGGERPALPATGSGVKNPHAASGGEGGEDWRLRIAKLELGVGDTLVCQAEMPLSMAQASILRDHLETCAPSGVRVLILDPGVTLTKLEKVAQ